MQNVVNTCINTCITVVGVVLVCSNQCPPGYCSEGGALRKMETAKLLKTAPYIHTMIENLLDIDVRKEVHQLWFHLVLTVHFTTPTPGPLLVSKHCLTLARYTCL